MNRRIDLHYTFRMVVLLAVSSFFSAIVLALLGYRLIDEERGRRLNLLFGLFCIAASYVSFCELFTRLAETIERAMLFARLSCAWPLAPALYPHFCLLLATGRRRLHPLVAVPIYAIAASMAVVYWRFVDTGQAIISACGFSLVSPVVTEWPYWPVPGGVFLLYLTSFGCLLYGTTRSPRRDERRQIRWILWSYAGGFGFTFFFIWVGRLFSPPLPELTGLTYAAYAVAVFAGILNRRLLHAHESQEGDG